MSEMGETLSTLRDLHPRRLASSLLDDSPDPRADGVGGAAPRTSGSRDSAPRAAFDPDAT
jgi:hypothetical protein